MKLRSILLACLHACLVFSCVTDGNLKKIDPYYVFHDNNSKVWMINHCYKDGKDHAPVSNKYKEIITFHKSSNCYVQPMNTFGDEAGRKGSFTVNGKKKTFAIEYQDETLNFRITALSHDRIVLAPEGKFLYTLELVPVPEP